LNRIHNIELLELAISDRVGSVSFHEDENGYTGRLAPDGGLQVRTATLDWLVFEEKISPPHCIKMDIEGAELSALNAAGKTFQQFHPVLFLSTHGREVHTGCRQLLESWGYNCKDVGDAGALDRGEIVARFGA
jgi:FkbM family methyltransferase